jgi:hypothetical protein
LAQVCAHVVVNRLRFQGRGRNVAKTEFANDWFWRKADVRWDQNNHCPWRDGGDGNAITRRAATN